MLLRENHYNDWYMFIYDKEEEALDKAKELEKDNETVSVVLSKGEYFVESPSAEFIRVWEKLIYKKEKGKQ
jgi:hypothetical protein